MRVPLAVGLAMTWLLGCSPELPSSTPLGSGPLAEPESEELGPDVGDKRPRSAAADAGEAARDAGVAVAKPGDAGSADDASTVTARSGDGRSGDGGTDEAGAGAPAPFAGEFCGRDVTTLRCDGRPDLSTPDPAACIEVERKSDTEISIVIIYTPTGEPFCTLKATVAGRSAVIEGGQTCPDPNVTESLAGSVTRGTATLDDDHLSVDLEAELQGPVTANCPNGALIYHFDGDRK